MAKRVESPSSINTFKQCARKYYYQYIEKLPTYPNIHTVRGNIAHSALENFFDIDISNFNEDNYGQQCMVALQRLLMQFWQQYKGKLDALDLSEDKKKFYFEETMLMLINWSKHFIEEVRLLREKAPMSIQDAFVSLTPIRELEYRSEGHSVRGFIDAIHHIEKEVHLIDYKTNSRFEIKDSIKLQLAIYSLLYLEKHGKLPDKVGVFFLRQKLQMIKVDKELYDLAKREIEMIHAHTSTTEHIADYPKKVTPLCKWSTGECNFYDTCKPHG